MSVVYKLLFFCIDTHRIENTEIHGLGECVFKIFNIDYLRKKALFNSFPNFAPKRNLHFSKESNKSRVSKTTIECLRHLTCREKLFLLIYYFVILM
jgi:hypothetical protein